jgi:hypothetical protein
MVNFFQILNQFVVLFRKNVIEKSSMIWRVLPLVKTNTHISETACIYSHKRLQIEYNNNRPIRDENSKNNLGDLKSYLQISKNRMIPKMNVFDNEEVIQGYSREGYF